MNRIAFLVTYCLAILAVSDTLAGDAISFGPPTDWSVGDPYTTYQQWDVFPGTTGNQPDVGFSATPTLATRPTLNALPPGFLSSSNNFYAFFGRYNIEARIYNHTAAPTGLGTLVRIQTSATQNPDPDVGGPNVFNLETVRIVTLDGQPIPGGANSEMCHQEVLWLGLVPGGGGFDEVMQEEDLFEFWLPNYTGDFKFEVECLVHVTYKALRIDAFLAPAPTCHRLDINCDCRVDILDVETFAAQIGGPNAPVPPGGDPVSFARAMLDLDNDVDLADLSHLQTEFPG